MTHLFDEGESDCCVWTGQIRSVLQDAQAEQAFREETFPEEVSWSQFLIGSGSRAHIGDFWEVRTVDTKPQRPQLLCSLSMYTFASQSR